MGKPRITQAQFVERSISRHGDKYDYSAAHYVKKTQPVEIVCPDHGSFFQRPDNHWNGAGCPTCALENASRQNRLSVAQVLEKANLVHGGRYTYDLSGYKNGKTKVTITCPDHGEFRQTVQAHLSGQGCPECSNDRKRQPMNTTEDIVSLFRAAHGDRYDYSETEYRGWKKRIKVVCREHGPFLTIVASHVNGKGHCPVCKKEAHNRLTQDEVIRRFKEVHGDVYNYSKVRYENNRTPVEIGCPFHGLFQQTPERHFIGQGCPTCGLTKRIERSNRGQSNLELEMIEFLRTLNVEVTTGTLPGEHSTWIFDAIIESHKLVIEFNGLYWHSYPNMHRGAHLHKRLFAESRGYRMVTIWEDQWVYSRERTEMLLRRIVFGPVEKIGARKTEVYVIDKRQADSFHESYHVQGKGPSAANIHYGLFFENTLVGVASFDKSGVLHRYTVGQNLSIAGGLNKLIRFHRSTVGPVDIVTYCDRDHFDGGVYRASGFEKVSHSLQMTYMEGRKRVWRGKYMKNKLSKVFGIEKLEGREIDICADNGVRAIWNSGVDKYVLRSN